MFNKIIVILILILMIVSTIAPAFAFAKGQMEPEGRMFSQPSIETMGKEPVTTGSAKDYSQKKEVVLDDILRVYPDTLDDPEAVVVGYKLTAVDMPVTFPFYVLVDEEKDTYSATELGLSPILWCGDKRKPTTTQPEISILYDNAHNLCASLDNGHNISYRYAIMNQHCPRYRPGVDRENNHVQKLQA